MSTDAKSSLIQHSFVVPGADPTLAFWTAELSAMGVIAEANGEVLQVWTCPDHSIPTHVLQNAVNLDNPVKAAALSALCYHLYVSSVTAQRYANMKEGLNVEAIVRERGQV